MTLSEETLEDLREKWCAAVLEKDTQRLINLYSKRAVFNPSLSTFIRRSPEEIRNYFEGSERFNDPGFLNNGIIDVRFESQDPIIEESSFAVDVGRCVFVKSDGSEIIADYTLVCSIEDGQPVILAHHSSLI